MKKLILYCFIVLNFYNSFSQIVSFEVDNYITSPTTGQWTVPQNVTQIKVQCWGAGGGGGGATGQATAGGGGSGGAYTENNFNVISGQIFSYSVGNGGISSYSNGGIGASTWFQSPTTLLAKGGNGGAGSTSACCQTASGAPAITNGNIGGSVNYYGGAGGTGTFGGNGSQAGGGGGGAGSLGNGMSGGGGQGGNGGQGISGNGAWAGAVGCNCFGNNGSIPGGGGSGAQASGVLDKISGAGGGGRIVISYIKPGIGGKVFLDQNLNCLDDSELGLKGVRVIINPGNSITETDENGNFSFNELPTGTYVVELDTNRLNKYYCISQQIVNYTDNNVFYQCNPFGIQTSSYCTSPDISIFAPTLRPCTNNTRIYISACNLIDATSDIQSAYVDVSFDTLISITSASIPFVVLTDNTYRFDLNNISIDSCINFQLIATVSCNALMGQTICMDALLFPSESCVLDTVPSDPITNDGTGGTVDGLPVPCSLPWDQSSLTVDGWCQNDSVYFYVENHGSGDMDCYLPVMVYVDGVLTQTDSIQLVSDQGITYVFPAYGETWILNAEQHPLHPGNSHPNAHVEACGDTINFSRDFVNEFPQDDADPMVDIYCGVVTSSYDPNDKTGYPIGQTTQKYIQPNQQLQYVIRFQNTGTDTAFTVVIRDTLDIDLNIFTVTAGVSSHPYTFRMYGPRVLEWTFNNILLPDSTTNSDGSNGFVTFHVDQVPNLSPGTEITNDADIYFDFNDPITTNTTIHRIYEGFVSVLNIEDLTQEGKSLLVFPNPTAHTITIKGEKNMNQSFQLFDQMGREVFKGKLTGTETEVNLSALSKGMYTLKIEGNYQSAQIVKE